MAAAGLRFVVGQLHWRTVLAGNEVLLKFTGTSGNVCG